MLINKKENSKRVKFVSYTGEYPNLCDGVLTLEIDGVQYKFGHNFLNNHYDVKKKKWVFQDEDEHNPNFDSFWHSGGECYFKDSSYEECVVEKNEWKIDMDKIPYMFYDVAEEIDAVFNENVPWGCCGGCL